MRIFYSWQSDNHKATTKYFIEECLREVIKDLNRTIDITGRDEELHTLDKDTQGVPGYPDIPTTVIKKISDADCFVADLSFVAKHAKKGIPIPNVMYELGYAIYSLGDQRVIAVMNTHYGEPKGLPFDIVQRRFPVQYCLAPEPTEEQREEAKKQLKRELTEAMNNCAALPAKESLPPLQVNVSYLTILNHILASNLSDWSETYEVDQGVLQVYYHKDPQLRVLLDQTENGVLIQDYKNPWANCFLHPSASSFKAKILYNSTLIHTLTMVFVDEGSAIIPQPIEDLSGNLTIWPLPYKIGQLFDTMKNLDDYIERINRMLQSQGKSLRVFGYTTTQ